MNHSLAGVNFMKIESFNIESNRGLYIKLVRISHAIKQ